MKQETKEIIKRRLNRLNKYLNRRGKRYHARTIHSFRLEVKKLRSFLALLSVDQKKISLPKRLKKLYKIMGRVRLIQLQRNAILETTVKYHIPVPTQYLFCLDKEKRELMKESKSHFREMKALNADKFNKEIPDKIGKETYRKYLSVQQYTLDGLMHANPLDEQSLHQVRKILKDTLYDLPYIKDEKRIDLDLIHDREDNMKTLESKIGKFHDISVALQLLAEAMINKYGMEENKSLISIRDQWQKDRDDIRSSIDVSGASAIGYLCLS